MKKLIALLLVLVMALSVVACTSNSGTDSNPGTNQTPNTPITPDTPETPADAGPNADLVLDENNMGVCPLCKGEPVQWIPLTNSNSQFGFVTDNWQLQESLGHRHIYLAEDITSTRENVWMAVRAKYNDVCLHLNNKTLNAYGDIRLANSVTFNIIGKGNVTYTSVLNPYMPTCGLGMFVVEQATLNIYGGTYTSEMPIVLTQKWGEPKIFIKGDASLSGAYVNLGTITVDEGAVIDKVEVAANPEREGKLGKLWVAKTFTGEIKSFTFPGEIADNKVPVDYGAAIGAFTGKVTTADGVALAGSAGALTVAAQ